MRTRGGNKKSNSAIAKRRLEVAKRLPEGEKVGALAKELGVSRITLWRDIKKLTLQFSDASREAFQEYRQAHLKVLQRMAHAVLEQKVSPDVAGEFRKYQQDIAKLLGLNAEARSVVAHVSATIDPAQMGLYNRFLHETRNVPAERFEELWAFCRTLRAVTNPAAMLPPIEIQGDQHEPN